MKIGPFEFRPGLRLGPVKDEGDERVVGYEPCEPRILDIPRGVYVVADRDEIFYIGKFERTFGKRWVYSSKKRQYLYHGVKNLVREELDKPRSLTVYVQDEATLKRQIGLERCEWVDVNSIEAGLIRRCRAAWNRMGVRDGPDDALLTVVPH